MIRLAADQDAYETDELNGKLQRINRQSRILEFRFPLPQDEYVRGLMAEGADRGTKVHTALHLMHLGDLHWECSTRCGMCGQGAKDTTLGAYLATYTRTFPKHLEVVHSEKMYIGIPHPGFAYGCTIDRVHSDNRGTYYLDDFKTKARPEKSLRTKEKERHVMQLSAYVFAHNSRGQGAAVNRARILQLSPTDMLTFDYTSEVFGGGIEEWKRLCLEFAQAQLDAA